MQSEEEGRGEVREKGKQKRKKKNKGRERGDQIEKKCEEDMVFMRERPRFAENLILSPRGWACVT